MLLQNCHNIDKVVDHNNQPIKEKIESEKTWIVNNKQAGGSPVLNNTSTTERAY